MKTIPASVALLACVVLAGACNKPEYIEIEPKQLNFTRRGETVSTRIIAKNRGGHVFPGVKAAWKSSNPQVMKVDEQGRVESVGPGRAMLVARAGGLEAEAPVEVITVEKVSVEPAALQLTMQTGSKALMIRALDHQGAPLKGRRPSSKCADEKVCTAAEDTVFPTNPGKTVLTVSVEGSQVEVPVTVTER